LDIKMPRMSGLEAAEQISTNTMVVFVTAFDDHAIQAFDQGAIDYVMKPIRVARMAKSILRLKQRLADQTSTSGAPKRVAQSLHQSDAKTPRYLKFIQASIGRQVRFVMVEEIVYVQSDSKYTRIVTLNSEAFIRKPLSELETELDPDMFWRIHRSTLVNVRSIDSVVRDEAEKMSIKLKGLADRLEVSRVHQSQFRGL
ncbi:MAG: LytR/AlgR family response regulator transcription factor, partial [Burkholderiales bacterium]